MKKAYVNEILTEREERIITYIIIAISTLFILCLLDLVINHNKISYDEYGNTCHGNIVKVCSGDLHE